MDIQIGSNHYIIAKHLDTMQALLQSGQYQAAAAYSNEVSAQAQVQAHLGICENPIVDAYLFSRSQELERQGFRVQLRVLLPGGLRVPISRTYRSTAREQFFSRLQI